MPVDLEIVSPERLLLSRPVDMVVIPAAEGEMGVMPDHAPMIVLLRGGVIRLYQGGIGAANVTDRLFVSGGFAEVTGTRVTVLADEATPASELVKADAQRRLTEAEAGYNSIERTDVVALDLAMDRIQSARARVEAAGT